jgi:Glycosyltransferase family 87
MMSATATAGEAETLRARRFWPHDLILALIPLLVGFEVLVWTVSLPLGARGLADFRQLYTGGYMLRTGHAAELYDYDTQQRFEEALVPVHGYFLLSVTHPAFEELLFVPLSLLSYRVAYLVFLALNVALLALCVGLLRHRLKVLSDRWKWFPTLLIAAFYPISRAMMQGQDSVVMLTLLAAALWTLDRQREFAAGLLVGVGIFKFQIAIPIALLFLMWRRWHFSVGFAFSSAIAGLASLWLVGFGGARDYVHMLLSMSVQLTSDADMLRNGTNPSRMLNLRGLVSVIVDGRLPHGYVQFLIAVCSVAVLLTAARQRPSLPLAIAAASLVSYHLIDHDASALIIVIAAALCSGAVWNGIVAILLLIAPLCAITHVYGYLAAIPLLGLFLLMLRPASERSGFICVSEQEASACR